MFRANRLFFGTVLLMASLVVAEVSVSFTNSTLPMETTNDLGTLTLSFSVDATGNVVLDASATAPEQVVRNAVDEWDGPVGTISYSAAFNTVFSLVFTDVGGSGLKLANNDGGGLGVGGYNAWRIDRPGLEYIDVQVAIRTGKLEFRSVSWNHRADATVHMTLAGSLGSATNDFMALAGVWDVSALGFMVGDNETLRFGNVTPNIEKSGYALAGFTFDVVDGALITVGFVPDAGVPVRFSPEMPKRAQMAFSAANRP